MEQNELRGIPPWLMSFLVHVVGRCCGILMAWIDAAALANGKGCREREPAGNGRARNRL